ncbi:dynein light [Cystoisospora suis]|uniref:Dynein light n=1 Tax=Cystoisospora suis TaxID=483139 RepID=A0A2C6KQ40_9APIC|nr:dynein light [Cystoisospora suis]
MLSCGVRCAPMIGGGSVLREGRHSAKDPRNLGPADYHQTGGTSACTGFGDRAEAVFFQETASRPRSQLPAFLDRTGLSTLRCRTGGLSHAAPVCRMRKTRYAEKSRLLLIASCLQQSDFVAEQIQEIARHAITQCLSSVVYKQEKVSSWCAQISDSCLKELAKLNKAFKYIGMSPSLALSCKKPAQDSTRPQALAGTRKQTVSAACRYQQTAWTVLSLSTRFKFEQGDKH